ncbi:aqualysin-1-like [Saccoglossus kowalevskii]|uniref:Alkaline protease 1-like n=1 Tax=Saccoglossus kowalevskii TaxID=10224 RepID=A0ABM0MED4_SACKO|nr:PREDICTED: alkaline protease 1-like [Saccoglossus kowalevskii]
MLSYILCVTVLIGAQCQAVLVEPKRECGLAPVYHGDIPDAYAIVFNEAFTLSEVQAILGGVVGPGLVIEKINCNFVVSWAEVTISSVERMELVRALSSVQFVQGVYGVALAENWGLDRINQRLLPLDSDYLTPRCVVTKVCTALDAPNIYLIDTGILYTHEEFEGRAKPHYDHFPDEGYNGIDIEGHGTHVAGIAGGKTFGVSKNANLWSVRIFNKDGVATSKGIWHGLLSVFNDGQLPAVINLSIVSASSLLDKFGTLIIRNIQNRDRIPVIVAAGNKDSDAGDYWPANSNIVTVVGATDSNDVRATFSNVGEYVNLFAPGVDIESAGIGSDTEVVTKSGTSMSTPYVTGIASRIKTQVPGATAEEVLFKMNYFATKDVVVDAAGTPNRLFYGCHP